MNNIKITAALMGALRSDRLTDEGKKKIIILQNV